MLITSRGQINAGSLGLLPVKEGADIGFGSLKREAVMGDSGVLGHTESFEEAPYIKVVISDSTETDKKALQDFVGETVVFNTNNGQTFTLKDAWVVDPLKLTVKDGQIELTFQGMEML